MTLSMDWVDRISAALEVSPSALLGLASDQEIPLIGTSSADGSVIAFKDKTFKLAPNVNNAVALSISKESGHFQAGDVLICERMDYDAIAKVNDMLCVIAVTQSSILFGRVILLEAPPKDAVEFHESSPTLTSSQQAPFPATSREASGTASPPRQCLVVPLNSTHRSTVVERAEWIAPVVMLCRYYNAG